MELNARFVGGLLIGSAILLFFTHIQMYRFVEVQQSWPVILGFILAFLILLCGLYLVLLPVKLVFLPEPKQKGYKP